MRLTEGLVIAPLLGLIVFLGVYPTPMLERIQPSVERLVEHVDLHVDDFTPAEIEFIGPASAEGEGAGDEHGASEGSDEGDDAEHGAAADLGDGASQGEGR